MLPSFVYRSEAFAEDLGKDGAVLRAETPRDPLAWALPALAWLVLGGGALASVLLPPP
jgi:hypothetical protein